jgi:hypothetical protein
MARIRTLRSKFKTPHFIVVWDLQWQVLQCERLELGSDLDAALDLAVGQLEGQGWRRENAAEFAFVFVSRGTERRLVTLTARDPFNATLQTFSPFGAATP